MKPLVKYDADVEETVIICGRSAYVKPIDHPDSARVSNKKMVFTSTVLTVYGDGSFETVNTMYVPSYKVPQEPQ